MYGRSGPIAVANAVEHVIANTAPTRVGRFWLCCGTRSSCVCTTVYGVHRPLTPQIGTGDLTPELPRMGSERQSAEGALLRVNPRFHLRPTRRHDSPLPWQAHCSRRRKGQLLSGATANGRTFARPSAQQHQGSRPDTTGLLRPPASCGRHRNIRMRCGEMRAALPPSEAAPALCPTGPTRPSCPTY